MTPEILRLSLLRELSAHASSFCTEAGLVAAIEVIFPKRIELDAVRAELLYLQDKGFVAPVPRLLAVAGRRWRITAAGRDVLETEG